MPEVSQAHESPVLVAGKNCWRKAQASQAAFLVDADAYFSAFADAVAQARESILIIGWDIDSRTRILAADNAAGLPPHLGDLLNTVVSRRRGLHAHLLGWDYAMIYLFEREHFPVFKLGWRTHRRIHFHLDGKHPVGASQHQKIVVVDDSIAFVGGLDLTIRRWDTSSHEVNNPLRVDPAGEPYSPFHDVQMMVQGEVAASLGDLARERWLRATGEQLAPPRHRNPDLWPAGVPVDLRDATIAIARTAPAYDTQPLITEVESLHLDLIAAARRWIYIENQYFTSSLLADALARRLQEAEGPEVVMVLPEKQSGWLEEVTMGVLRARVLRRLEEADQHGRLRVYYPKIPCLGEKCLGLHSKVLIVDDSMLRLGSANMSNRSMRFDSECDLALEAGDRQDIRAAIERFRNRLLGEHLGIGPERVAASLHEKGSLIAAVESLSGGARSLAPLHVELPESLDHLVPEADLLDPETPLVPEEVVKRVIPEELHSTGNRRLLQSAILLFALSALAAAWYWTPLGQWLNVRELVRLATSFADHPLAPAIVLATYVLGSLVMLPVSLLIVATAITFGPLWGFLYALTGSLLGAAVTFGVGHAIGRDALQRLGESRLKRLSQRLAKRGILAIALVRIVPVAPFSVVNLMAGASHIRLLDFMIGTLLGMAPGILAISAFGGSLMHVIRHPGPKSIAFLAGVALAIGLAVLWVRRWLDKGEGHEKEAALERRPNA
ncbi:VTT domain-containing protein [Thermithiobacillus plumbiphilus]|uniref:VTT domain-containing protein n=1 Tax=Thermithiobacillus plumbiphilus TaxID=1729899 RepID=A0ABU9D935_9PROT